MVRLFFGILLIVGLACAGFGGWQLFGPDAETDGAAERAVETAAEPVPAPISETASEPVAETPPPVEGPVANGAVETEIEETVDEELMFGTEAMSPNAAPNIAPSTLPTAPPPAAPSVRAVRPTNARADAEALRAGLREVPVAFAPPETASFGTPFDIEFALDATGADSAADALTTDGDVIEGRAKVSERVKASLVGAAFEIEMTSPDVQLLGSEEANRWRWRVTPKAHGSQRLHLELFAMIGEDVRPVRTFEHTVTVEVTRLQQAVSFANAANPLAVFLGGIGSTLGGLFGLVRFLGRRG